MTSKSNSEEATNSGQDNVEESTGSNLLTLETNKLSTSDESKSPNLSREPSGETYTDYTGTDLLQFLSDTLQNNPKDRIHLLKIEKQLTDLVKDPKRNQHKFGPMSSYHRMLVHRVAAFFGMDHNVNSADNSVIVSKTRTTRLPEFKFSEQIKNSSEPETSEPVKSIIKRDSSSLDKLSEKGCIKDKSPDRRTNNNTLPLIDSRRSKSLEEREEEYEKARARIFNQDSSSSTEASEVCANTSIADESVTTSSSGIVVSTNATNSSPSCSHEDLKPGNNWPSTDSRLWSSTESEGSNRPRYLRLQRQKRLPDSFDSDSARTSFTTSSSMSSASGMFLTPDSCLTDQQLSDLSSANKLTFTKASSFGGISVLSRDNSCGPASEPKLTKTASLTTPTFTDHFPRSSNHESLTIFPQSNGSQQLHLWPKKQLKSNSPFQHGNNQGNVSHTGQDQGIRALSKSNQSGNRQRDENKTVMEHSSELTRTATSFEQSNVLPLKTPSNREIHSGRSASESSSNKNWPSNSQQSKTSFKHDAQYGGSTILRNQSSSNERSKNYNHKEKPHIGPQIIINPVGGACMPQIINNKSPVLTPMSSAQPFYHLSYIQTAPSVVVDPPNLSHEEINKSQQSSSNNKSKHLTSQMASLSINSQSSRSSEHYLSGSNSGRSTNGHSSNITQSDQGNSVGDINYRTTGHYAIAPLANLHAQKSVLPMNPVSSAPQIPFCYIHPSLQAPQSSVGPRFTNGPPQGGPTIRLDGGQVFTDRFISNLPVSAPHHQSHNRLPDNYNSNIRAELDVICQSGSPSQSKSNLVVLGSQLPVNTSNYGSYQPLPLQQSSIQVVSQVQSLAPSFPNQPQTNRLPNVPFTQTVPASVPASSGTITATGGDGGGPPLMSSLAFNNGMMNPSPAFPYAINHISLPPPPNGQLTTGTNFSYSPPIQVPPTVPMYVNTNGGNFAPNQLAGARPMPPPQAQIMPTPYSPQASVYRPVPLFFIFNFQNKRSN